MVNIVSYAQVYDEINVLKHRYLLLGNGFSIALRPDIFTYKSLYAHAELEDYPHLVKVFEDLGTEDFELVIKNLVNAARLLTVYAPDQIVLIRSLKDDAHLLKAILVQAIAKRHPDRPYDIQNEQYEACRVFLEPYGHIYTLNYDVLLYWTLMQDEIDDLELRPDDGFRHPEGDEDAPYVSWEEAHSPTIHYIHGALHLFDTGSQLVKFTWSKTDIPLLEQIRNALDEDRYPLFVAEGTSHSKMDRIMHNAYLHKSLRSFESCAKSGTGTFVVYGHSLADNDQHVLRLISKGKTP